MHLLLTPGFSFAQFKRIAPIQPERLWELIYERNAHNIKVKKATAAVANLELIFNATFRLANRVGFGSMSLRDLADATGMSIGGLYGYLQSKEALAAMIEDVIRHVGQEIPRWFRQAPTEMERIDGSLRAHIFMSELLQPWFYFVFMESRVLGAEQRKVARAAERDFQEALALEIAQLRGLDSHRASLLAAQLQGVAQDWYVKRWKYKAEKISVDEFADCLSGSIAAQFALPAAAR